MDGALNSLFRFAATAVSAAAIGAVGVSTVYADDLPPANAEPLFESPGMTDADGMHRQMKAFPAGDIDTELRKQIEKLQGELDTLRRTRARLDLQQRRCGSAPVGECRAGYDFLKQRYETQAGRVRMGRMKLQALYRERQEHLKARPR